MRHHIAALAALILLSACQETEKPGATAETSPGGIAYTRLYMPGTSDVAIQVAWPSDWMLRDDVNPAVPHIGAELILAGGAEGFPPGEVTETFADLKANGTLWVTPDVVFGELVVPKQHLAKAVGIAAAHLATPAMDRAWFQRIRHGLEDRVAEMDARADARGFSALRWAVLGDTALRRALSLDDPGLIGAVTLEALRDWHRQTFLRSGAKLVVAGEVSAQEAGQAVDDLLAELPMGSAAKPPKPKADFAPRRILLHVPDAKTATLVFMGPLPPTRDGAEVEDVLLTTALGVGDQSLLFDTVRTGLRASYGFGATLDGFSRDLRLLILSGEVEPAKLAEAERLVRAAYAGFVAKPDMGDLTARKAPLKANAEQTATDPAAAAYSALLALLDGQDPGAALDLAAQVDKVTSESLAARAASAFPEPGALVMLAVSPDLSALPGACVITAPEQVSTCPRAGAAP